MKESFMLVSLKEDKARKLSQVLSNPTATRILEFLTAKEATETEISKELKIPLSTVHYNLKQLTEAKLVTVEEFHYSSRGKEVNHYRLANKYIIIAPSEDDSFLERLRKFLPAALVTAGVAVILKLLQISPGRAGAQMAFQEESMAMRAADMIAAPPAPIPWWQSPAIDWAILGAAAVLVLIIIAEFIRWKLKK